ncbi:MAG: hypothetical protein CL398_05115 [Acidiferrobacteraceae bacterium]|nr:hypothetical protein [Acidiferrobacteraceae bacterium]
MGGLFFELLLQLLEAMTRYSSWVQRRIEDGGKPLIVDGGMGTELEKAGVPMDGRIWSGHAILSSPHVVQMTHEKFIEAGAEAIIANTFSTARHVLEPAGLGNRVREINVAAIKLARQARDATAQRPVAIVGSICEWTAETGGNWSAPDAVGDSAKEQGEILAEAGVDVIALEMCERIELSQVVAEVITELSLPVWIGVSAGTCREDGTLPVFSYPERDFEELVVAVSAFPVSVINVMHTAVGDVVKAMEVVRRHWSGPIGVYPESGYFTMPNWQFIDIIEPFDLAQYALEWAANGARLIGGCCGLGPAHIRELHSTFDI